MKHKQLYFIYNFINIGKDATSAFKNQGHSDDAISLLKKYTIGHIGSRDDNVDKTTFIRNEPEFEIHATAEDIERDERLNADRKQIEKVSGFPWKRTMLISSLLTTFGLFGFIFYRHRSTSE